MTVLAAEAAVITLPQDEHSARRLFEPSEVTLEDWVLGAWEALAAHGRAECPVCRVGVQTASGCNACGSHLS